jgi:hypothetical protein
MSGDTKSQPGETSLEDVEELENSLEIPQRRIGDASTV